jgi:NADH-quinone oxidoreductase subunit L
MPDQETVSRFFPLGWLPLLPLAGALFAGTIGRKLSKSTVGFICTLVVAAAFILGLQATIQLLRLGGIIGGEGANTLWQTGQVYLTNQSGNSWTWIAAGALKVDMAFWMDPLTAVMVLLVTFVGGLIHLYSIGYMHDDKGFARYFAYLNLFTASMLILVLGKNLLLLFIGWEGVGLCSYLLIGFWYEDSAKASAGKKAFLVNRVGDFGFLLGIFAILACQLSSGSSALSLDYIALKEKGAIFANLVSTGAPPPGGGLATWDWTWATVIGLLLFVGAAGKSAQIPLYVWLPDAMAGPTPVSALIHAATMVTAGVFMVARMGFLYAYTPEALAVVGLVGGVTALFAAIIAIPQNDIKKVLAYSTVSQLGLMFVAMGTGAFWVGIFHVLTHAFFKACLFLGSGSVIHAMGGEQDIRKMGGLKKYMPHTHTTFLISTLAIAGIPPLAGFFSKDEILWQAFSKANPVFQGLHYWVYALAAVASLLTAFYMFRLYSRTFLGECRADEETKHHLHESPAVMTIPLWILAVLAAVGGLMGLPKIITTPLLGAETAEHANELEGFLEPSFYAANERAIRTGLAALTEAEGHEAAEWGIVGLATLLAVGGALAAYSIYRKNRVPSVPEPLYKLAVNKFYVDEIYNFLIVRPLLGLSYLLHLVVDEGLIDSFLVRIGPRLAKGGSMVLRRLQSGNVQQYAAWVAVGAAAILFVVLVL